MVEKMPGKMEMAAISTILFGMPKMARVSLNPTRIKIAVEAAIQIAATRYHFSVLWKILSAIMPLKIAAKIMMKYVRKIVSTPLISSLIPQTAVMYVVKYVVKVKIM